MFESTFSYFFEGLDGGISDRPESNLLEQKESMQLLRAYYGMEDEPRRRFLELAKVIGGDTPTNAEGQAGSDARPAA